MSIEQSKGKKALIPPPPPTWGDLSPPGEAATIVRFVLPDRVVTFVASELKRWEHIAGEPEVLMLQAGRETVVIEGRELATVRAALDAGRLAELRPNMERSNRPGPRIQRIAIEAV